MADPVTALMVIGGVAEGVSAMGSVGTADAEKEELDIKSKQETIQYQQKTLQNYSALQKVTDAQLAEVSAKGVALNSPSFNAIQRDAINTASKQQKNLDLEEDISKKNISIEKQNVNDSLFAALFGGASRTAVSFAGLMSKMQK